MPDSTSAPVWHIGNAIFIGVLLAAMTAIALIWLPYDRIVVFDQPWATTVRMSSIHLKQGGFAVLYLQEPEGWRQVGQTFYLPPGYYQNVVVGIDIDVLLQHTASHFIARLYEDTGDYVFQETVDVPVKDVFGNVYTKHFWFDHGPNVIRRALGRMTFQPVPLLIDTLFP